MFRLLGFLIGSVTALAIILMVLGVPDFHLTDRGNDQQRFDAAVKKLKEKQQEVADVGEMIVDEASEIAGEVTGNVEVVAQMTSSVTGGEPAEDGQQMADPEASPPDTLQSADERPVVPEDTQWYSFWNPFRSEIAARGFVSQLEKVTGLDYRIVKVRSGVYEVAFAYDTDSERLAKLSQISAATGLDLPES